MEKKLNLDIPGKVSELEVLLNKVLPKNIIYRLVFGKGLEFDGYKDFTPDDDASLIDWKATVRAKKILIKKYIEERDLKFVFVIDVSENMVFGSTEKLKCEYIAELSAALCHLILISGDRVGFVLFSDRILKSYFPSSGTRQFDIFVQEISEPYIYGRASDLNSVLEELTRTLDRTVSLVFIISDFVRMDASYLKNLELFSGLFETVAVIVRDPLDKTLPSLNKEIIIEDTESYEKLIINPRVAKNVYERNALQQLNFVKESFNNLGIDFLELSTERSFAEDFAVFLKERIKKERKIKVENVY